MMRWQVLVILALPGCGAPQPEARQFPDAYDPAYAASFDGEVDPRVSTSGGEAGGVVVLWPRVVPGDGAESVADQAAMVQERLRAVVAKVLPDAPLDVRPSPERACPLRGCKGVSVGAVLAHAGRGCALVATVSRPGQSATLIVPWSSTVAVKAAVIPFRDPPESQLSVRDYVPCADLGDDIGAREPAVEEAVAEAGAALRDTTAGGEDAEPPCEECSEEAAPSP
jgi:hypothetical protein